MGILQSTALKVVNLLGITAKGQATMANSLPVAIASDQGGFVIAQNFNVHIFSGASIAAGGGNYSAGDVIGAQKTLTALSNTKAARLDSITVRGIDNLDLDLQIVIFGDTPAGSYADNAPFSPNAADLEKIEAIVPIAAADWLDVGTVSTRRLVIKNNLNHILATGGTGYLVVVTTAAITGLSANAVSVTIGSTKDA